MLLLKIFPEPGFFCHSCVPILGLSWAFHVIVKINQNYHWTLSVLLKRVDRPILINLYYSSIPPLLPQKIFSDDFDFVICAIGYSIFYPYGGVEGKFPGGVPEVLSRGVRVKIVFPRGLGQVFQRGHTG